jgi:hypothetical protein
MYYCGMIIGGSACVLARKKGKGSRFPMHTRWTTLYSPSFTPVFCIALTLSSLVFPGIRLDKDERRNNRVQAHRHLVQRQCARFIRADEGR